jgi:hypothetical protein
VRGSVAAEVLRRGCHFARPLTTSAGPGLPPGRSFRLLLIGYFEGVEAERAIAWRAADSFALREFLGLVLPTFFTPHVAARAPA